MTIKTFLKFQTTRITVPYFCCNICPTISSVTIRDTLLTHPLSTDCRNSDGTSHSIVSRFGLEIFCAYKPHGAY